MPGLLACLMAQDKFSRFERINIRQGLASSVVYAILQDRDGFMWFGTEDGLCRYDGSAFTVYRPQRNNPGSLSENLVSCLLEDPAGDLWVGTYNGLNRRIRQTGKFQRYLHDPDNSRSISNNSIRALCLDHTGALWVGTRNGGLNRLDRKAGFFTCFRHDPANPRSLGSDRVTAIMEDRRHRIWVATDGGGLHLLDPAGGSFTRFQAVPGQSSGIPGNRISTIFEDRQGRLWAGTIDAGLFRFDPATGSCLRYPLAADGKEGLSDLFVRRIVEDRGGNLWIATNSGGLNRLETITGKFTVYRHHTEDPGSLSHFQVTSLCLDRTGMLWIGTYDGICKLDLAGRPFHLLRHLPDDPDSLSDNSAASILEDSGGGLWIGTDRGGLNYYDPANGRFRSYMPRPNDPSSLMSECVTALLADPAGDLWVGTYEGLCRLSPDRKRFTRFVSDPDKPGCLRGTLVMSLLRDRQGVLWAGTNGGLNRLNPDGRTFTSYRKEEGNPESLGHDTVFALREDRQGRLWVGTNDGGISVLDTARQRFRHYLNDSRNPRSLSSNVVFVLYEDRHGIMWAGTAAGLNRFDPATGGFTVFTTVEGLPNDSVIGILEDRQGRLWLSTLRGICRLDPRGRLVRNYDSRDGFSGDEFFQGAAHQGASGRFYFGATGGLTFFRPEEIRGDAPDPPAVLTSFKVFNQDFPPGQALSDLQNLSLEYRQNSISFEYTALEYRVPEKIRFAYRLENFDAGWVQAGNRRVAAYTNLDPGEYRFQVKAANSEGHWGDPAVNLSIAIPPPFWQSAWFRLLGILLIIGLSNLMVLGARKWYRLIVYWRKSRFISHFRVLEKLGRGGMGTVYKVEDLNSGQIYALKVMNEELVAAESDRQRFIEESFICETLNHPNVIRVFEKGEVDNSLYYTMEYFDGRTLQEQLRDGRPDIRSAAVLSELILDILHDIHQQGVIHRDIKPGNIMLSRSIDLHRLPETDSGQQRIRPGIRILDFGLARFLDSRTLTRTGSFAGSLQYLPPEYLKGLRGRNPACDYYSTGVILYELLTGQLPYHGTELWEMIFAIAGGHFPAPRELCPEIPEPLSHLVTRMIHPDENLRLSDYPAIKSAFQSISLHNK